MTIHTYKHCITQLIYICICNTLGITLMLLPYHLFSLWETHLIDAAMFVQEITNRIALCHINHNILEWNLVNESHFSLSWHLLPVSQTTYLYQMDQLLRARKPHYWITDLFILTTSGGDSGPRQPALVSSGSGLGRHPNCSLKLPHSSRILQDASH